MCVIVFKKENFLINHEILKYMWDQNPHGAGYMFCKENKLIIVKGLMTFDKFLTAWKHHEHLKAVIHFRIKTYGEINAENTHPFYIQKHKVAIAHNGSMTIDKDFLNFCGIQQPISGYSDTWHFANKGLKGLPDNWWNNNKILLLLQAQAKYNKFVIMDNTNKITIINEKMGDWLLENNVWVSNTIWKPIQSYQKQQHNTNNYNKKHFSINKSITTKEDKIFDIEDNKKITIPKNSMGYITKYLERNKETQETYWYIKFYANKDIPVPISTQYTFPFGENEMTLNYVN